MSVHALPRREFLLRALAACGAPLFVSVEPTSALQKAAPGSRQVLQTAAGYFGAAGADSARALGEAYARHLNLESAEDSILRAANNTLQLIANASSPDAAIAALVRAVRRDFHEGRSVQVDGWVLSRTELELCLLTLVQ